MSLRGLKAAAYAATAASSKDRQKLETISKDSFQKTFMPEAPPTLQPLVDACFNWFDLDHSGDLDFPELVHGLSKCCLGSDDDKAEALFEIFDSKSDGHLRKADLMLLLTSFPTAFRCRRPKPITAPVSSPKPNRLQLSIDVGKGCNADLVTMEKRVDEFLVDYRGKVNSQAFKVWAKENLIFSTIFGRFDILLSPSDERSIIAELMASCTFETVATWYVVSFKWWSLWMDFVGFERDESFPTRSRGASAASETSSSLQLCRNRRTSFFVHRRRPTAMDNSDIQSEHFVDVLKDDLRENYDFVLLPAPVHDLLHSWYGGGPLFPRHIIRLANDCARVELYPLVVSFCWALPWGLPDVSTAKTCLASSRLSVQGLVEKAAQLTDTNPTLLRLWLKDYGLWLPLEPEYWWFSSISRNTSFTNGSDGLQAEDSDDKSERSASSTSVMSPMARPDSFWSRALDDLPFRQAEIVILETHKSADKEFELKPHLLNESSWTELGPGDYIDAKDFLGTWHHSIVMKVFDDSVLVSFFDAYRPLPVPLPSNMSQQRIPRIFCDCVIPSNCSCSGRLSPFNSRSNPVRQCPHLSTRPFILPPSRVQSPGLCGLQNLTNTCFIASSVQALAQTPILVGYFLSKRYAAEINRKNKLGTKGRLADEFSALLASLWSGKHSSIAPNAFKRCIHKYAPRFSDHSQHDSQELLSFVIDALHEDLNRVKQRPMTVPVDSEGRDVAAVGEDAWKTHLLRNDSIIVDLFHGQLKSSLSCPSCPHSSLTFDPFSVLSVPLPLREHRRVMVRLLSHKPSLPSRFVIAVRRSDTVEALVNALADRCGAPEHVLVVADLHRNRVFRILDVDRPLATIRDSDYLIAFEQDQAVLDLPEDELVSAQVLHRRDSSQDLLFEAIGTPLVLVFERTMSRAALHDLVRRKIAPWTTSSSGVCILGDEPLCIRVLTEDCDRCALCEDSSCLGCILDCDEERFNVVDSPCQITLVLSWSPIIAGHILDRARFEFVATASPSPELEAESISLLDCMRTFLQQETLGETELWTCPKCAVPVQATKKIDLWRLPEVLVVHLKRFLSNGRSRQKISTLVDFPVSGFDLSGLVDGPENSAAMYDLFAVVNHVGSGAAVGHYTATVRHLKEGIWHTMDDSNVSVCPVSAIRSNRAYVLFYKRVH